MLMQKKSRDGCVKQRFCIDYRPLKAVTTPAAFSVLNIVHTSDLLGQSNIFTVRYGLRLSSDSYET